MGRFKELKGKQFGKLTVIEYLGCSTWKCECSCKNKTIVNVKTGDLTSGHTQSCGCNRKKYEKDETFFEKIDSESKAYILGFIAADGSISIKNNLIKIDLKKTDDEILIKMMKEMKYNNTLKYYHQHVILSGKEYEEETARLNISSHKMVEDIQKYGITEKKSNSLSINFSLIPEDMLRHFMRGLMDGDGCITTSNTKNGVKGFTVSLTSSNNTIDDCIELIQKTFPNIKIYKYHRTQNKNNATFMIRNKQNIKDYLDWLYYDSTIYLERKYKKYLECKENIQ